MSEFKSYLLLNPLFLLSVWVHFSLCFQCMSCLEVWWQRHTNQRRKHSTKNILRGCIFFFFWCRFPVLSLLSYWWRFLNLGLGFLLLLSPIGMQYLKTTKFVILKSSWLGVQNYPSSRPKVKLWAGAGPFWVLEVRICFLDLWSPRGCICWLLDSHSTLQASDPLHSFYSSHCCLSFLDYGLPVFLLPELVWLYRTHLHGPF